MECFYTVFRMDEKIQPTGKIENQTRIELSKSISRRDGRKIQKSVDKNLFKSNELLQGTLTKCHALIVTKFYGVYKCDAKVCLKEEMPLNVSVLVNYRA